MRNVIFAINITLDGCCDHTKGIADDELLDHYTQFLREATYRSLGVKPRDISTVTAQFLYGTEVCPVIPCWERHSPSIRESRLSQSQSRLDRLVRHRHVPRFAG